MEEKLRKNIGNWETEKKTLESLKRYLKKYAKLKDAKAEKADLDKVNKKITEILEEHDWIQMEWKDVKRSKASREEGVQKLMKTISDKKKKIENATDEIIEIQSPTRDWSEEISQCQLYGNYYHWAYGKMEVAQMEGDYIFLRLLDKKGCKHDWLERNNAIIDVDGKTEELKKFSLQSIGRWIFPDVADVEILDKEMAHKFFAKK